MNEHMTEVKPGDPIWQDVERRLNEGESYRQQLFEARLELENIKADAAKYWNSARTTEPKDNQMCHIVGAASYIVLNVCYKHDAQGWLDLFNTPEAGAFYSRDVVWGWIPAEQIPNVPDAFEPVERTNAEDSEEAAHGSE